MRREWWMACSSSSRLMSFSSSSSLPFLLEEVVVKSEIYKEELSKFKISKKPKKKAKFLAFYTTQTKTFESERASERASQKERERERNVQHPTSLDDDADDHESGPIHRWFWSGVQQKTILFEHIFNEQQQLH